MSWIVSLLTIVCSFYKVKGRSDGVTSAVCLSMFPVHGTAKQQITPSPFVIRVGATSFEPSQHVNVTLLAHDGRPFIGVILNAQAANTDDLVGSFLIYPDNKTKTGDCSGGSKNYITHANNLAVRKIEATWIAPEGYIGNVTFRATFMESFDIFWINVEKDLKFHNPFVTPSRNELVSLGPLDTSLKKCGSEIGCLLYPSFCTGRDCDIGATYRMHSEQISFQMWARASENAYVSIGFSDDRYMGYEQTVTCTHASGMSTFQYGINTKQQNSRQSKRGRLKEMATLYQDGRLYCTFTMHIIMNVTTGSGSKVAYDMRDPYHVMIAWGPLHEGTDVIMKHTELPIQSIYKIQFYSIDIHRANALPLLAQIHGVLMMAAWILFVSVTIVVGRYYKSMYPETHVCGTKMWFQLHRATAVTVFVFTAVSFVIIFVKVDGLSNKPFETITPYITIFIFDKIIQIISVCGPAVTTVMIFNIGYLPKPQEEFGTTILCFWIRVQVLWESLFEIMKYRDSRYSKKTENSGERTDINIVMLWCFISTMVSMLIPAFMTVFFF